MNSERGVLGGDNLGERGVVTFGGFFLVICVLVSLFPVLELYLYVPFAFAVFFFFPI